MGNIRCKDCGKEIYDNFNNQLCYSCQPFGYMKEYQPGNVVGADMAEGTITIKIDKDRVKGVKVGDEAWLNYKRYKV